MTSDQSRPLYDSSVEIDKLAAALCKVQASLKPALKDSTNPHFKSSYADLDSVWRACREPLAANELAVTQLTSAVSQQVTVTTVMMHSSGQYIASDLTLTATQNNPQAVGSAITYARRYALSAIVGVSQDDDDGNDSSKKVDQPRKGEQRQQELPANEIQDQTVYHGGARGHSAALRRLCLKAGIADEERQRAIHAYLMTNRTQFQHIIATIKELYPT